MCQALLTITLHFNLDLVYLARLIPFQIWDESLLRSPAGYILCALKIHSRERRFVVHNWIRNLNTPPQSAKICSCWSFSHWKVRLYHIFASGNCLQDTPKKRSNILSDVFWLVLAIDVCSSLPHWEYIRPHPDLKYGRKELLWEVIMALKHVISLIARLPNIWDVSPFIQVRNHEEEGGVPWQHLPSSQQDEIVEEAKLQAERDFENQARHKTQKELDAINAQREPRPTSKGGFGNIFYKKERNKKILEREHSKHTVQHGWTPDRGVGEPVFAKQYIFLLIEKNRCDHSILIG